MDPVSGSDSMLHSALYLSLSNNLTNTIVLMEAHMTVIYSSAPMASIALCES